MNKKYLFLILGLIIGGSTAIVSNYVSAQFNYPLAPQGAFLVMNDSGNIGVASTSAIYFDNVTGYLGLGTTSPQDILNISASGTGSSVSTVRLTNRDAPNDYWRFGINPNEDFVMNWKGDVTAEFFIDQTGDVKVASGDLQLTEASTGIILKSPDGTCVKITATDVDGITVASATCI